jgi:hypothetical protein
MQYWAQNRANPAPAPNRRPRFTFGDMSRTAKSFCWVLGIPLALCAALFAFRWLGVLFVIVSLATIACRENLRSEDALLLTLAGFLFCSLLPVDTSLTTRPGLPKLLPVCYGKPRYDNLARAQRGEVVLGGCMVRGYEPLWVIVW